MLASIPIQYCLCGSRHFVRSLPNCSSASGDRMTKPTVSYMTVQAAELKAATVVTKRCQKTGGYLVAGLVVTRWT